MPYNARVHHHYLSSLYNCSLTTFLNSVYLGKVKESNVFCQIKYCLTFTQSVVHIGTVLSIIYGNKCYDIHCVFVKKEKILLISHSQTGCLTVCVTHLIRITYTLFI